MVYNRTTQTVETQQSIWLQLSNFLRSLGEVLIAVGRALIRIGEFIYEVFFNASLTAHILGGCIMGEDERSGVIDTSHRLFGHDNLFIVDASVIPANLGVNPVMTIVAFAERAMSLIPEKE